MRIPAPTPEQVAGCEKDPTRPPTFRGSDFTMRWEQGRWSESRIMEAINNSKKFRAIAYGRSQLGPSDSSKMGKYWAEYAAAESHGKRPDLLVLKVRDYDFAMRVLGEDPTIVDEQVFEPVVRRAVCGIEAENSLWVAKKMPDFTSKTPLARLDLKSPNIWVKDQDLPCLLVWMHHHQKPILVVQVFYDLAYAVPLLDVLARIEVIQSEREPKARIAAQKQAGVVFRKQGYTDSRTNEAEKKLVYVTHHSTATLFGELQDTVTPKAQVLVEKNGKILPYVAFEGGRLRLTDEALELLGRLAQGD